MSGKSWTILALAAFLAFGTQPAAAQGNGVLTNTIELEKSGPPADGREGEKSYTAPDVVVPGDRIRVTLTFTNDGTGPATGVNLTNPIPDALIYDGTSDTADFAVSVDGAKSFGALDGLTVAIPGAAPRPATAADVTHVRWLWSDAIAPSQSRTVAFFGRVR